MTPSPDRVIPFLVLGVAALVLAAEDGLGIRTPKSTMLDSAYKHPRTTTTIAIHSLFLLWKLQKHPEYLEKGCSRPDIAVEPLQTRYLLIAVLRKHRKHKIAS